MREGGTYFPVLAIGQAVRNDDGNPTHLIGTITDLSAQGDAQKLPGNGEVIYRSLYEQLPVSVFMVEPGGRLVEVNPKTCEVLGYDRSEFLEKNLLEVVQASHVTRFISISGRAAEEGSSSGVLDLIKGDGTVLNAEVSLALLPDGNFLGVLREAVQGQYREETNQHAQVIEGFERFARGLAHELNNLLTPVIGYAQLSERALVGHDNVRNYLKEIQKSADRATTPPPLLCLKWK